MFIYSVHSAFTSDEQNLIIEITLIRSSCAKKSLVLIEKNLSLRIHSSYLILPIGLEKNLVRELITFITFYVLYYSVYKFLKSLILRVKL